MNDNEEWITLAEWPKYMINIKTYEVYSLYVNRIIKETRKGGDGPRGYKLWKDGSAGFVENSWLRAYAARFNLLRIRNEMALVIQGAPKTGEFVIGSIAKDTGIVSISPTPARQLSMGGAKTEAARLAGNHKEKKFVVFRVEAIASVDSIKWE